MATKYQLKSNLSESQIEADVATFFGWISKGSPFRLHDTNEQLTGADKEFYDSGFTFYMQFKKSEGLLSASITPISERKNRSKLEDIRAFRQVHGLPDNPTLYFPLRRKAKNATDFQHNVLLKYANKRHSQAFYVAPLTLDKQVYYNLLFNSVNRYRESPFYDKSYGLYLGNWVSRIGFVPFLKDHISIIPHEKVITHEHFYSFSETGSDVGWHSPEMISKYPIRLSDILSSEIKTCINENRFVPLRSISDELGFDFHDSKIKADEPLEVLKVWGNNLYKLYDIKVFVLLANSKLLKDYRQVFE